MFICMQKNQLNSKLHRKLLHFKEFWDSIGLEHWSQVNDHNHDKPVLIKIDPLLLLLTLSQVSTSLVDVNIF